MRCIALVNLSKHSFLTIGNLAGPLDLTVTEPGATFGEFVTTSITLSSATDSLTLPARSLIGGILFTSLSEETDPRHQLVAIIRQPFRVLGRVGSGIVIDEPAPALPDVLRMTQGACLKASMEGKTTINVPLNESVSLPLSLN
jgi:hypothetical protein